MDECNHEREHEEAAVRAKRNMPEQEQIISLATAFKAISEPSRLKILFALRQGEMCVYHITEVVGGTQSAVSHQLRILRQTKLVKVRKQGKEVYYSLADDHVASIYRMALDHVRE